MASPQFVRVRRFSESGPRTRAVPIPSKGHWDPGELVVERLSMSPSSCHRCKQEPDTAVYRVGRDGSKDFIDSWASCDGCLEDVQAIVDRTEAPPPANAIACSMHGGDAAGVIRCHSCKAFSFCSEECREISRFIRGPGCAACVN